MTQRKVKLIDTSKMEARYETAQSASDQAAANKCESIRVYAVTVHDGRGPAMKWDVRAWIVEEICTSRWQGEESPAISQVVVIGAKMPTPRVSCRFGDPVTARNPRSHVENIGTVVICNGVAVLRKTLPGYGGATQYEDVEIADAAIGIPSAE